MPERLVPEGRKVRLPGRGTTYVRDVAGPPGAPTVVLLHGLGATTAINWPRAFHVLSSHFRVLALDQRGHGGGIRSRRPFRLEDCADDVVALADALSIPRLIPVGYSMGGPIAIHTAHRHPDRVDGMVLCATSAVFGGADEGISGAELFSLGMRLVPARMRRQMARTMMRVGSRDQQIPDLFLHETRGHDPAAVLEAMNAVRRFDARPWLHEITAPAAVVLTTRDRFVPPELQVELARRTRATVHPVEADHEVAMRASRPFLDAVFEGCWQVARARARS